jgi:hypothetical protein
MFADLAKLLEEKLTNNRSSNFQTNVFAKILRLKINELRLSKQAPHIAAIQLLNWLKTIGAVHPEFENITRYYGTFSRDKIYQHLNTALEFDSQAIARTPAETEAEIRLALFEAHLLAQLPANLNCALYQTCLAGAQTFINDYLIANGFTNTAQLSAVKATKLHMPPQWCNSATFTAFASEALKARQPSKTSLKRFAVDGPRLYRGFFGCECKINPTPEEMWTLFLKACRERDLHEDIIPLLPDLVIQKEHGVVYSTIYLFLGKTFEEAGLSFKLPKTEHNDSQRIRAHVEDGGDKIRVSCTSTIRLLLSFMDPENSATKRVFTKPLTKEHYPQLKQEFLIDDGAHTKFSDFSLTTEFTLWRTREGLLKINFVFHLTPFTLIASQLCAHLKKRNKPENFAKNLFQALLPYKETLGGMTLTALLSKLSTQPTLTSRLEESFSEDPEGFTSFVKIMPRYLTTEANALEVFSKNLAEFIAVQPQQNVKNTACYTAVVPSPAPQCRSEPRPKPSATHDVMAQLKAQATTPGRSLKTTQADEKTPSPYRMDGECGAGKGAGTQTWIPPRIIDNHIPEKSSVQTFNSPPSLRGQRRSRLTGSEVILALDLDSANDKVSETRPASQP